MTRTAMAGWALVLLAATSAAAQPFGNVEKYLGPSVRTYDAQGNPAGELPVGKLPTLPIPIKARDEKGHPGIEVGGKLVYLKPADVVVGGIEPACKTFEISQKSSTSSQHLSEIGVSAGAAETSIPCIDPKSNSHAPH